MVILPGWEAKPAFPQNIKIFKTPAAAPAVGVFLGFYIAPCPILPRVYAYFIEIDYDFCAVGLPIFPARLVFVESCK